MSSSKKPKARAHGSSVRRKRTSARQFPSDLAVQEATGWVPEGDKKPPAGVLIELALFGTDLGVRTVILGWLEGDDFVTQSPSRLWKRCSIAECNARRLRKPSAFPGVDVVAKGHGWLFPQPAKTDVACDVSHWTVGGRRLDRAFYKLSEGVNRSAIRDPQLLVGPRGHSDHRSAMVVRGNHVSRDVGSTPTCGLAEFAGCGKV